MRTQTHTPTKNEPFSRCVSCSLGLTVRFG